MAARAIRAGLGCVIGLALGACAALHSASAALPADPYTPAKAVALRSAGSALPGGPEADVPFGYVSFCMRFTTQCPPDVRQAAPVAAWRFWPRMVIINRRVNRAIRPETALRHYGRPQFWTIPKDGRGDCVDYALTKRRDLARAGIPLSDLNLAIVKLPDGGFHAVLVVSTRDGDYILDNLRPDILLWKNTGYDFLSRMSARSSSYWVKVGAIPGALPPLSP